MVKRKYLIVETGDEKCPYQIQEWKNGKLHTTLDCISNPLGVARQLARDSGCELWVYDGTMYDKDGKRHIIEKGVK